MGRAWHLDVKIRVIDSMGIPYPLNGAFLAMQGARDRGVPITFEAKGPDAERVIEMIAEVCTDPPPIGEVAFGHFFPGIFGGREEAK